MQQVRAVQHTLEFDRIVALPKRKLDIETARKHARYWTRELRRPRSTAELTPWQGYGLTTLVEEGGLFAGWPVGQGKTLLFYLACTILGKRNSVMVAPKVGHDSTWAEFTKYRKDWKAPEYPITLIGREHLGRQSGEDLLTDLNPGFVCIDEADELANLKTAGCTRRVDRFRTSHRKAVFLTMTGTPSRDQFMGFWHLICWALPNGNAPVPYDQDEAMSWAAALDGRTRAGWNVDPGPMGATREKAQAWLRRRLSQTPGIMLVDEDSCTAPLTIRIRLSLEDPKLNAAYERFMLDPFESPTGEVITDPLQRWGIDARLGSGLCHYYDPPPPKAWRLARRASAKVVRAVCARYAHADPPIDTEAQVMRRFADHPDIAAWKEIKPTFKGKTKTKWVTTSTLRAAQAWLAESDEPGIVFVGSPEFGARLARRTGLAYYGRKGQTADGASLHLAPPSRSLIASWNANKRIFNLQAWGRILIIQCPQSAKLLEQIIGRPHRRGRKDPVVADILATSGGTFDAFASALAEADGARNTIVLTQKILRAKTQIARPKITTANQYRWATRKKDS